MEQLVEGGGDLGINISVALAEYVAEGIGIEGRCAKRPKLGTIIQGIATLTATDGVERVFTRSK
jgi:hypothetical protein